MQELYNNFDLTIPIKLDQPAYDLRSRHRYEVNPEFVSKFEAAGMKFVGQDEKNVRMEVRSIDLL